MRQTIDVIYGGKIYKGKTMRLKKWVAEDFYMLIALWQCVNWSPNS